jgi:hypothetical protein
MTQLAVVAEQIGAKLKRNNPPQDPSQKIQNARQLVLDPLNILVWWEVPLGYIGLG